MLTEACLHSSQRLRKKLPSCNICEGVVVMQASEDGTDVVTPAQWSSSDCSVNVDCEHATVVLTGACLHSSQRYSYSELSL